VGLERGPNEELLGRKSNGSSVEIREYGRRDPSRGTLYPQKLALTSPTNDGRSVGIARSRTQATEFLSDIIPGEWKELHGKELHFKISDRAREVVSVCRLN
jgi:hypothetical protein